MSRRMNADQEARFAMLIEVRTTLRNHLDDCKHAREQNSEKLDNIENTLKRMTWGVIWVSGMLITGMAGLIIALIHGGGHL